MVVFTSEIFDDDSGFGQRPELFPVEALVAPPAMKALHKTVLPWAARLGVNRLDLIAGQPALHFVGDKLRAIVAAQVGQVASEPSSALFSPLTPP